MELEFLNAFKPDADALLRRLARHVDDATLELIAGQNPVGGEPRRTEFMTALRHIRDGGSLKKQSDFASWDEFYAQDVTEILEFSRFVEADADEDLVWHWPRAFACAVLLRAYADPEVRDSSAGNYNDAMIQLIDSVRRLDAGLEPETMAALAWFITRADGDRFVYDRDRDQAAFAGVALLSLAAGAMNDHSPETIMQLTDWLIAEEKRAFDDWGESVGDFPDHWLFRTTYFSGYREKWMAIGAELEGVGVTGPCGDAVRMVGRMLSGQTAMP